GGELVWGLGGPRGYRLPSLAPSTIPLRNELDVALAVPAICWLVAWWPAPRGRVEWIVVTLVLVQVVFFLGPPLSLTDVFNYLHYGRLGAVYCHHPFFTLPI